MYVVKLCTNPFHQQNWIHPSVVVLYNTIVEYCILIDAHNHVCVLRVLIDKHQNTRSCVSGQERLAAHTQMCYLQELLRYRFLSNLHIWCPSYARLTYQIWRKFDLVAFNIRLNAFLKIADFLCMFKPGTHLVIRIASVR